MNLYDSSDFESAIPAWTPRPMMQPMGGMPTGADLFSREALFGDAGWAKPALGIANSLMGAYLGMQQYGLAKKTLAENKRQFNLNFDAQRSTVNSQLADRQRARVASNPTAYQSVSDYMGQYGIKG